MLDSNTILGIRAYLECEEYEHGLLSQNTEAWPCGTPVVYAANALNYGHGRGISTRVYTLMPPNQKGSGIETAQVSIAGISPIGLRPLYKNHKVLTVREFDIDKFSRLLEFTRDVGGISLVIEYEGGRKNIIKGILRMEKIFKYCSLFYYAAWPNKFLSGEDDKFVCILTFLDLPYCIPLFNTRKVDGVGLSFSGATIKASKEYGHLHRIFKADFIYSNYEDNVFFVDGIAVNSKKRPESVIYKELNNLAIQSLEIGKPDKRKGENKYSDSYGYNIKYTAEPGDVIDVGPTEVVMGTLSEVEVPHESITFNGNNAIQGGTSHLYTTTGGIDWNAQVNNEPTPEEVPWESSEDTESTTGEQNNDPEEEGGN